MTDKEWPSRYGTLGEKIFGESDPFPETPNSRRAADLFSSDEMPPTRNPLNSKEIYTSKSKLRAAYRAAGAEEVGTAYENGYDPGKDREKNEQKLVKGLINQMRERLNGRSK